MLSGEIEMLPSTSRCTGYFIDLHSRLRWNTPFLYVVTIASSCKISAGLLYIIWSLNYIDWLRSKRRWNTPSFVGSIYWPAWLRTHHIILYLNLWLYISLLHLKFGFAWQRTHPFCTAFKFVILYLRLHLKRLCSVSYTRLHWKTPSFFCYIKNNTCILCTFYWELQKGKIKGFVPKRSLFFPRQVSMLYLPRYLSMKLWTVLLYWTILL